MLPAGSCSEASTGAPAATSAGMALGQPPSTAACSAPRKRCRRLGAAASAGRRQGRRPPPAGTARLQTRPSAAPQTGHEGGLPAPQRSAWLALPARAAGVGRACTGGGSAPAGSGHERRASGGGCTLIWRPPRGLKSATRPSAASRRAALASTSETESAASRGACRACELSLDQSDGTLPACEARELALGRARVLRPAGDRRAAAATAAAVGFRLPQPWPAS